MGLLLQGGSANIADVQFEGGSGNKTVTIPAAGGKLALGTMLSGLTAYHLLQGDVSLAIQANKFETVITTSANYTPSDYIFCYTDNKLYDCILASTSGTLLTNTTYFTAISGGTLSINNALIPFANGIDSSGTNVSSIFKNESITGLAYTAGKNYVYAKADGSYGVTKIEPKYPSNVISGAGIVERNYEFSVSEQKWKKINNTESGDAVNPTLVDFFGDTSCKALYTFEDNCNDLSGSFNGTGTNVTYSTGKYGKGVVFNGTNSLVDTTLTTNYSPVTFSFWVKFNTLSANQVIMSKRSLNSTYGAGFNIYLNASGFIAIEEYNGVTGSGTLYNPTGIVAGEWYHVAIERNGTLNKVLVNGVNGSIGTARIFLESTSVLRFGQYINQGLRDVTAVPFNGMLDQVRIFNRSLTTTEIQYLGKFYNYEVLDAVGVNFMNHVAYADASGQLTYVEELPKVEYKDSLKVDNFDLGQSWQQAELTNTGAKFKDGTSKFRALGMTYWNTTGKPIEVTVSITITNTLNDKYVSIDGSMVLTIAGNTTSGSDIWTFIVPNGSRYSLSTNGNYNVTFWSELR